MTNVGNNMAHRRVPEKNPQDGKSEYFKRKLSMYIINKLQVYFLFVAQ